LVEASGSDMIARGWPDNFIFDSIFRQSRVLIAPAIGLRGRPTALRFV
jgi:hypothetical protein